MCARFGEGCIRSQRAQRRLAADFHKDASYTRQFFIARDHILRKFDPGSCGNSREVSLAHQLAEFDRGQIGPEGCEFRLGFSRTDTGGAFAAEFETLSYRECILGRLKAGKSPAASEVLDLEGHFGIRPEASLIDKRRCRLGFRAGTHEARVGGGGIGLKGDPTEIEGVVERDDTRVLRAGRSRGQGEYQPPDGGCSPRYGEH